ncbi:hypothetical protein ACHAWF_017199 [Thalassiosira exigua]
MQAAQSAAEADGVVQADGGAGEGAAEAAAAAAGAGGKAPAAHPQDAGANSAPAEAVKQAPSMDQLISAASSASTPPDPAAAGGGGGSSDAAVAVHQAPQDPAPGQKADSSTPAPASSSGPTKKAPLRRGKWTPEEEAYASRLIQEFKAGLLPLTDGTTLRTFLSKLLNCDPMRISKKFVGSNCIGKQVFRRRGADVNNLTPDEIERTRFELSELEKKFLDRVAQKKSSKAKGGGGRSSMSSKSKSKSTGGAGGSSSGAPSSGGGGTSGGGGLSSALGGSSNSMNKSAAAVGRALLQGNKAPSAQAQQPQQQQQAAHAGPGEGGIDGGGGGGTSSAGGLLAQLQTQQPGMFDNNTARSFLNAGAQGGGLGNTNTSASITNLMLQTGMTRDQISQLSNKGILSSASLANMLGKQRSFDQLMSLDFQSMQSIDNLANLIQAGMPNQGLARGGIPKSQMKNVDWGTQGPTPANAFSNSGNAAAGLLAASGGSIKGSLENLVRSLSNNSRNSGQGSNAALNNNLNNQSNATNFNSFLQNVTQQSNNLGGGLQGTQHNSLSNFIQNLQQQQQQNQQQMGNANFGNLLQGMGGSSLLQNNNTNAAASLLQNNSGGASQNNTVGNANNLMNMLGQSTANNLSQQNLNPLMQQLNNPFGRLQNSASGQGNPVMAALAQQQLLASAGGGNNVGNLLGQQNGLAGLGMNNSLGNFGNIGAALGGNLGANLGGNFGGGGGGGTQDTASLIQQIIAQQNTFGGANNQAMGAPGAQAAVGGNNSASGLKRSFDESNSGSQGDGEEGGPNKKPMTASL